MTIVRVVGVIEVVVVVVLVVAAAIRHPVNVICIFQAIPAKLTGLESFENNNSIKKNLIELTLGKTFVAAVNNRYVFSLSVYPSVHSSVFP